MPDSSIFLSGSDINTHVGAWVPVSPLTLRREGSHALFAPTFTFQARTVPEGLTVFRRPWEEELQEAPQPLPTWYKWPRSTCCSNSRCTPSVGLLVCMAYRGKGASGPCKPLRSLVFLQLCSEKLPEKNSVLAQLYLSSPCLRFIFPR